MTTADNIRDIDHQRMIERYTGLFDGQDIALEQAITGALKKLNPARHKAMSALISPDLFATPWGIELNNFVGDVRASDYYLGPRDTVKPGDYHGIARELRKEYRWFSLGHLRILIELYDLGCESMRWLAKVYGGRSVDELEREGLIKKAYDWGSDWSIYELAPSGIQLMQQWGLI